MRKSFVLTCLFLMALISLIVIISTVFGIYNRNADTWSEPITFRESLILVKRVVPLLIILGVGFYFAIKDYEK